MPVCCIYNSKGRELLRFNTESYAEKRRIVVGRSSSCDVSLKSVAETNISREHFYIERNSSDQWSIHDTSRAGIVINCNKVEKAELTNGMVVRFGQLFFCFGEKAQPTPYRLAWYDSDTKTEQRDVLWNGSNSIGASHDNYVTIRLGAVSRFHCRIDVHGDQLTISNISPMVETTVNEETLHEPMALNVDDVIMLGDIEVKLVRTELPKVHVGDIMPEQQLRKHNKEVAKKQRSKPLVPLVISAAITVIIVLLVYLTLKMTP